MKRRIIIAIIIMGLAGVVAEILLLRELLITFHGNELSIGIILANWLILEALGAIFVGKGIERFKRKILAFTGLTVIFSLSFPFAVYVSRVAKEMIGVVPGEGLGPGTMFLLSLCILFPVSVSHGALFTSGCRIYSLHSGGEKAARIGRVYIYETVGTLAGGVLLTYILIPYFNACAIAWGIALINLLSCLYLTAPGYRETAPGAAKITAGLCAGLSLAVILLFAGGGVDAMHERSVRDQWKGQEIVYYKNSIYGNIAVAKREEQYTFFSDGMPVITTPVPDVVFAEEFVHLPMLFHPSPRDILVISGGAGGIIREIAKHPSVERIDYAELDPLILETVKAYPTPLTESELSDPRVHVQHRDGRYHVNTTPSRYDLIFIGLSDPSDLQVNRLFTYEFFKRARRILKKEGVLVVSLPGSLTYMGEELKDLNTCIIATLKRAFPYVRILPGDFNLLLASASSGISRADHGVLSRRLEERDIRANLLIPVHIKYKLSPQWSEWFAEASEGGSLKINRDFAPIGVFYSLSYRNALFSPRAQKVFRLFEAVTLRSVLAVLFIGAAVFLLLGLRSGKQAARSIPFCIAATGFAGMLYDLALIFAFQVLYGYVFYWIGLLVTALMTGIALGGFCMTLFLRQIKRENAYFIGTEALLILFTATLPFIFRAPVVPRFIFLILSALSGFLIGMQFPLANKIYLSRTAQREGREISGTAGLLYGADLIGGWVGGMLGGVILLPVLGLIKTCIVIIALKILTLIIFAKSTSHQVYL